VGKSNNALRGGPALRKPPGANWYGYINSDTRRKLTVNLNVSKGGAFAHKVVYDDYSLGIGAQPLDALNIHLSAGYNYFFRQQDQYVGSAAYNGRPRIIVGEVDQQTLRLTLRVSYNITPDLTIQYYSQPYATRPLYNHFGYVQDALNRDYDARFHRFAENEISLQHGRYAVDENRDGVADYTFERPDFNFLQFRSNLVVRWEYRPGSELYLVWSQGSTPDVAGQVDGPFGNRMAEQIFSGKAVNIGLVKFTYRFLR
jgi:hypothetical protein